MNQQQIFEYIHQSFSSELTTLETSMLSLSNLFDKLPVTDLQKKNWVCDTYKLKSAWYACSVNTHIDELLLPEFLENKQSRNILIKKETEQFLKSIEQFKGIEGNTDSELYEFLLTGESKASKSNHFDLFSTQTSSEQVKCPVGLKKMFDSWEKNKPKTESLETVLSCFLIWHQHNQYTLSNQRQMLLWLNYKFYSLFGQIGLKINHEEFLYKNWNNHKIDGKTAIVKLIEFWTSNYEQSMDYLKSMYKESIGFEQLKSNQKLMANYMFQKGFDLALPEDLLIEQEVVLKSLLSKGFVCKKDLESETELELVKAQISSLQKKRLLVSMNEGEIYYCLQPSFNNSTSKLEKYVNIEHNSEEVQTNWESFISQKIEEVRSIEMHILEQKSSVNEPKLEVQLAAKKKVFFG